MAAAELAIRARTQGCLARDVRAAVAAGELVVTWTLRGTRHLHAAEDVRWLVALFGPIRDGQGPGSSSWGSPGRSVREGWRRCAGRSPPAP